MKNNPQAPEPPTSLPNVPAPPPPPGQTSDISQKVLSLARAIDRLPAGDYSISLRKPRGRSETWRVKIEEKGSGEVVRDMRIQSAKIIQTHEGRLDEFHGSKI